MPGRLRTINSRVSGAVPSRSVYCCILSSIYTCVTACGKVVINRGLLCYVNSSAMISPNGELLERERQSWNYCNSRISVNPGSAGKTIYHNRKSDTATGYENNLYYNHIALFSSGNGSMRIILCKQYKCYLPYYLM